MIIIVKNFKKLHGRNEPGGGAMVEVVSPQSSGTAAVNKVILV